MPRPLHAEPHPQTSALPTPPALGLTRDERGTTTVEYVILLILVAVIAITAWRELGGALMDQVAYATEAIRNLGS